MQPARKRGHVVRTPDPAWQLPRAARCWPEPVPSPGAGLPPGASIRQRGNRYRGRRSGDGRHAMRRRFAGGEGNAEIDAQEHHGRPGGHARAERHEAFADAPAAPPLNPNPVGERERRSEQHRPCQTDGTEQETESPQHHCVARVERPAPATQLGGDDRQRDGGDTERHPRPGRPRAIAVRAQITPYGRGGEQRKHQARIDDRPARVQDGHSRHCGQHQARAKAGNHQIGHCNSSFVGPFPDSFGGVCSAGGMADPAAAAEGCRQQCAPGVELRLTAEARRQDGRRRCRS